MLVFVLPLLLQEKKGIPRQWRFMDKRALQDRDKENVEKQGGREARGGGEGGNKESEVVQWCTVERAEATGGGWMVDVPSAPIRNKRKEADAAAVYSNQQRAHTHAHTHSRGREE
jgi:hypothetical protein